MILSCFESCQGEGLEYWQKDTWQFSGKAEEKVLWNFLLSTPGWFVVDQTLFDHWRDSKFTCCMVGEACSRFLGLTVSPWISFNVKNGGKTNGLELKEEVHDWPMYLIRKKTSSCLKALVVWDQATPWKLPHQGLGIAKVPACSRSLKYCPQYCPKPTNFLLVYPCRNVYGGKMRKSQCSGSLKPLTTPPFADLWLTSS